MLADCKECQTKGSQCVVRYSSDLLQFGKTEWICPQCEKSYLIPGDSESFICNNCGFNYPCNGGQ